MLVCNEAPIWRLVDIWRVKKVAPAETTLYVQIPSCSWSRPERLEGTYPNRTTEELSCKLCVWLETLNESLEVMMVPTGLEAIVVRTNICKLAEAIKKALYNKSFLGVLLAQQIHCQLQAMGVEANPKEAGTLPLELVGSLVKGGTPHPFD